MLAVLVSCNGKKNEQGTSGVDTTHYQYYRQLSAVSTKINFSNTIRETQNFNYFLYPFIYFGGGVAIGDINNDGLPDIYFTSNMSLNALYLNQGGLLFRDITEGSGVAGIYNRWTTGVTMADVNADGYLDIYVSVAGPGEERQNLLYINEKEGTFKEMAEQYGVADNGHTIQSAFFDYDKDGDLDLYVGNYPPSGFGQNSTFFARKMKNPDALGSDKLYRNEGGHFIDVTRESGMLNYGLTLGLSVADFNSDGWPDIYVSNDFNSADCLYINNQDGTFKNGIATYTMHTSNFGMGTDAGDINNDGFMDLIQADMMGSTNQQQKSNMSAMNAELFHDMVAQGLHYQYMKNTLQLNTGLQSFMDIGELAGLAYTDWSWGPLLMDMNNDGYKDVFITNGMWRNVNDNDFNAYFRIQKAYNKVHPSQYIDWLRQIPVHPVGNFTFINKGDLSFRAVGEGYGLDQKGFSNGAAYGDLDLDGDLDLVVNNLDATSHIFENVTTSDKKANFLRFKLIGESDNGFGIGTRVCIYSNGNMQCEELYLSRGYQSSVEPIVHFGVGTTQTIDSVQIVWPLGSHQKLYEVHSNQLIEVRRGETKNHPTPEVEVEKAFVTYEPDLSPAYIHKENTYDDFNKEVLLPHKMSQFGPALAKGDINADGLDDFYVGGAAGFSGMLYVQEKDGSFKAHNSELWKQDSGYEDVSASFFDANGDEFPDLYVVSGSNEKPEGDRIYQDRLYVNNQNGDLFKAQGALPEIYSSGSCVRAMDYDQDGDKDLFVGGRQVPGQYPLPADSYLLRNESNSERILFKDVTEKVAPLLLQLGMVTDAVWADLNLDGRPDLVVVGEWMSPKVLMNENGLFRDASEDYGVEGEVGWWNSIACEDLDNDGDPDLIVGNLGLNYKYKATKDGPFKIFAHDFDNNDSLDIVLGYYDKGELFPLRGRECSSQQIPSIKKKFPNYTAFSKANLVDIYSLDGLDAALRYEAVTFAHKVFINDGSKFTSHSLPYLAQISSINAILVEDLNNDGNNDIILGGNLYGSEVETPRNDASFGWLMIGNGKGRFSVLKPFESGIHIKGEIRKIVQLRKAGGKSVFLIARNNEKLILAEGKAD